MIESGQLTKKKTDSSFIKRHKKLFVVLIIVAVVVVAGLIFMTGMGTAGASTQPPQTVTLQRMDLEQIVSGTGTLQSSMTREVTSSLSYDIIDIYVQEGDQVMMGQLLARLDTSQLDSDIAEVRKSISTAEAQDALSLSQAERKVQDAIDQYNIDSNRLNNEINKANTRLSNAKSDRDSAKSDMDNKKKLMDQANAAVSSYPPDGDPNHDPVEYAKLVQAAADAKLAYDAAAAKYESQVASVDQAQTAYDTAVQQRDTTLRQSNLSIESARDAVNTQKLRDSASTYRSQLTAYLDNLEDCEIVAPVAGTITSMTAEIGMSLGGGGGGSMGVATTAISGSSALFTIEDINRLEINSSVPEYDAVTLRVGMQAEVFTDAFASLEWRGVVKSISTRATDEDGNFSIVIEITSPVEELAIGMTAKINVITNSQNNVFAVPYDAVTKNERGQSIVYAYSPEMMFPEGGDGARPGLGIGAGGGSGMPAGGRPGADAATGPIGTPIIVETGMETEYYIEISGDGLEEGMLILADPEGRNVSSNTGGGFMFGGGF